MKQILVIHGGDAFNSHEEYIGYLCSKEVSLDRIRSVDWKSNLAKDLGRNFDVLTPRMPNAQNARYSEWKIWFEKIIPLLDPEVILVGHSLGGIFLVKFLSENNYPKHIIATFLVAAPYNTPSKHPLVDFNITTLLDSFTQQAGKITLYHSKDDLIVPFENAKRYRKDLPMATLRIFNNRGHFNDEHFPEIVEDIIQSSKN